MKRFFKKIFAFIFVFGIAFLMSACSSKQDGSDISEESYIQDNEGEPGNNSQNIYEEKEDTKIGLAMNKCLNYSDYSEGFAWNFYHPDQNNTYYESIIDKAGKMLFYWDSEHVGTAPGSPYKNGYAYIEKNGKVNVVDSYGTILYSCVVDSENVILDYGDGVVDSENVILAYGDGYTITRNYQADFDSSGYTYTVYSPDGSVISQKKTDYVLDFVFYLGHGIFGYYMNDWNFFNAKSNTSFATKIENPVLEDASFDGDDRIVYIGYNRNWSSNDSNYYFTCSFLSKSGEIISVDLPPEDGDTVRVMVSGEKCMIQTEEKLYIFDSSNNELKMLTLPYEEKIMWGETLAFGEEKIVVPLQGDDNKKYIIVVDSNGKLLMEPTLAKQYTRFSDNRMVLTIEGDVCVYDEKMNLAYSLSQLDFVDLDKLRDPLRDNYSLSEYSDGVAILSEWWDSLWGKRDILHNYCCLDADGNLLFNEIDTSEALNLNNKLENP